MPSLAAIILDFPHGLWLAIPSLLVLSYSLWRRQRHGATGTRLICLGLLRGIPLGLLVILAARPVWITREPPGAAARPVMVLLDRSESMSLEDSSRSRYQSALDFLRDRLLPELKAANLPVQAMLFDQTATGADGQSLATAKPIGRRTNLAGAIAQSVSSAGSPPLSVIALTDGIANETADNNRGLSELIDAGIPFIGIGFGSDSGVRTLSLREIDAPNTVPSRSTFRIAAQMEMVNAEEMPEFDLLLFRDGQLHQKHKVTAGKGSRTWLENFQLAEEKEGVHTYNVQLIPPQVPNLKCVNNIASTSVRISDQKELRILYIQGALTWDYKFVTLALRDDQTIKMTGLTRTSKQSVFRQNVESSGELLNGFPTSLEELAPFRVVVLSNLRPADLNQSQQDILARFAGELGGGILMIGGSQTFDQSWKNSRLEQLMPVTFSPGFSVQGLDRPFRMRLTEEALQHPVFQVADDRMTRDLWSKIPTFSQYGKLDTAKPGAQIWALHETEDGPQGRRILMASQRYGAGISAVIAIQNFWRWRLARDSEPQHFDRFWRQLFRYLSEAGRQDISIHLADQDLRPQMDVLVVLEKQPNPRNLTDTNRKYLARVENAERKVLQEQALELEPLRPVDLRFHAENAGIYTITVTDNSKVPLASRSVEIRDINVEFQTTGRDMETLRQWASVSDGVALKAEECENASELVRDIKNRIEQVRKGRQVRRPFGLDPWTFVIVLGCLGSEFLLRKRWGMR